MLSVIRPDFEVAKEGWILHFVSGYIYICIAGTTQTNWTMTEKIQGKVVTLRPAAIIADRKPVFNWLTNSDLTKFMMGPPTYPNSPITIWDEFLNDYKEYFFDSSKPFLGRCFIIEVNDEPAGQINHDKIYLSDYSTNNHIMRNMLKPLSCFLLLITFLFSSGGQIFGQGKASLSAGFGIPELINVGIQYRIEQAQIGIGFGYFPPSSSSSDPSECFICWGTLISLSGDIYYHFGKLPKSSDLIDHPWYAKLVFAYTREKRSDKDNSVFFLSPRIGRDINISKRVGIKIDLGINMVHYLSDPSVPYFLSLFGLPGIGIRVFYRI